jgi:hypothetical protein
MLDLDAIFGPKEQTAGDVLNVQPVPEVPNVPEASDRPDGPPWDEARADAVLAAALAVLDGPLARLAQTEPRREVLGDYRAIVLDYHQNRDDMLWEAVARLELLLARWVAADRDAAANNPPAAAVGGKSVQRRRSKRRL